MVWLKDWFRGPVKSPLDEGFYLGLEGMLCIVGVGLVAYHFVCYRAYQDDIDVDDERRE
ncbi:MAG TPA: hypothetical protein VG826_01840 [Pirellulales bacterium]|nr:hypothetical protein [Pirellulales bacterium]